MPAHVLSVLVCVPCEPILVRYLKEHLHDLRADVQVLVDCQLSQRTAKCTNNVKRNTRSTSAHRHQCELTQDNNNNNNKHAYAGHLNSFTHLTSLLVRHDRNNYYYYYHYIIIIMNHAYTGQLNSFSNLRAPLVLHDRGILGPGNLRRWARGVAYVWCGVSAARKGIYTLIALERCYEN
jgi:hypothetical protein